MRHQRFLIITSIITCYLLQAQGADKYTDENRPYEFGFTIDGQQHRHEEKDKNGIIKGEYGFITADGVYHITVYATDEQGRFKILSMKNIRYSDYVKGLPGPPSSARQGHSLQLPSSQAATTNAISAPTQKPQQEFKPISIEPPANSCSHCSLPTTSTAAPKIDTPLVNQQSNGGDNQYNPSFYPKQDSFDTQSAQAPREPSYPGTQINSQQGFAQGPAAPSQQNNYNRAQVSGSLPNAQAQPGYNGVQNLGQQPNVPAQANAYNGAQGSAQSAEQNGNFGTSNGLQGPRGYGSQNGIGGGQQGLQQIENARSGKQYTDTSGSTASIQAGQSPNEKPVLAYAQMQIVDKNTDIYAKAPGEKDGLPPGFKEDDMLKLLYTFNYTLGFQAHFEEGFTNGVKRGYYYSTGRNGVRTRIDYVADKDGFHPTLSQEVYDLLSEDVPKEETEKEEKYGLKGYEFKWLYFPVEKKGQQNAR